MNQDLIQFNKLIVTLFEGNCDEKYIIIQLYSLASKNKSLKNDIYLIILRLFRNEKLIQNKIKLFNVIDSLCKNVGQDYINLFSPILFDLFKATYLEAIERDRIQLFKLYYTWKYIIDTKILDKIHMTLNFDQMKLKVLQLMPETIERYDQYNEQMKAKIKHNAMNRMMNEQQQHHKNESSISNNPLLMLVQIQNQAKNQGEGKCFRQENDALKYNENPIAKDKVGLSDDLFSNSSPSNEQFSDDNSNSNNNKEGVKSFTINQITNNNAGSELNNIKAKLPGSKQFFEKEEDNERIDEKIKNIQKMKRKIKENKNKNQQFLNKKRAGSPLSHHSQGQSQNQHKKPNTIPMANTYSNINQITNPSMMNIPSMHQYPSQTANTFSQILQLANMNSANQNNRAQTAMNNYSNNIPLLQINQTMQQSQQQFQLNRPSQYNNTTSLSQTELSLQHFLRESSCNIKESFTFFSALSKYFIDTYRQSKILPTTKTDMDLFKSKDLFEQIHKHTYNTLFLSLRNICAVCGFRTKIYSKFIEHLDIHFHYNYLKKNSNNKVLCRKEGCDKESWITTSYMKNNNAYTLSAILYYQNDSDQMANNMIYKTAEVEEDNEDLLYPVNYGEDAICLYCADQLKKKYFSKYHYWFYVNVINVKQDDLIISNNSSSLFAQDNDTKSDVLLIHESCVDEYVSKISNLQKEKEKEKKEEYSVI